MQMKNPKRTIPAAILAVCIGVVGTFEGMRTKAYLDPVGIATICEGETEGVHLGQTATAAECRAKLAAKLQATAGEVGACLKGRDPTPGEWIAYTSAAYNIGVPAFCGSSMARQYNAGNYGAACDALLLWDKAGGHPLPGLTRRRHEERLYCMGAYNDHLGKSSSGRGDPRFGIRYRLGSERLASGQSFGCGRRGACETGHSARQSIRVGAEDGARQAIRA